MRGQAHPPKNQTYEGGRRNAVPLFIVPPLSDDGGGFAVFLTLFRNTNSGRYKNNNCGPNNNTCKLPRNKSKDQI